MMAKRLNLILPDDTIRMLDRLAANGNRSRLISEAIIFNVTARAAEHLANRMQQGAIANAQRDVAMAQEWFPVEEETCQPQAKPAKLRRK